MLCTLQLGQVAKGWRAPAAAGALGSRKGSGAPAIDVRPFLIDFEREVALLRKIGGGSFGEVCPAAALQAAGCGSNHNELQG